MSKTLYSRTLAGVLLFSLFSGFVSGLIVAAGFMPDYAQTRNHRLWYPGSSEVMVLSQSQLPFSTLIHIAAAGDLETAGLPPARIWRSDAQLMEENMYALVSHEFWRYRRFGLGDHVALELGSELLSVPVAGVWHPHHPQMESTWLVLVGGKLPQATEATVETLTAFLRPGILPESFRGRRIFSNLLFMSLVFLLYGILGTMGRRGRFQLFGWVCKLWCGAGVAVLTALIVAGVFYTRTFSYSSWGLLPMTLGVLVASYALAVLLISGLSAIIMQAKQ